MASPAPAAPPPSAAAEGVDRGQRIAGEARFEDGHDGKQAARFVRPFEGELPADVHGAAGETASPATTEDVVETPPAASVWEARPREED